MRWVCEVVTGIGVATHIGVVVRSYAELPARIPMHFDWRGRPDGWGPRWTLLVFLALALATQAVLIVAARVSGGGDLTSHVAPENALRQARLARVLIDVLKIEIAWLFAYLAWRTVGVARGYTTGLGRWFGVIVVSLSLLTPLAWLFLARSAR